MLTCVRWLDQRMLQGKGTPPQLLGRLEAAVGNAALQDDSLWSRLGNSKKHLLGVQGNGRRRRRGRRNQIEAAEDEVMEAGDPVASSSAASSSAANSDFPAGTPARITIGEPVRLPVPAAAAGVPARVTTTSSWEDIGEPMRLPALAGASPPADLS